MLEVLVASLLVFGIVAAASRLYGIGVAQQSMARNYSQVQTDLRTALRRVTRTLRHGFALKNPSTQTSFPSGSLTSNSTQVIVPVQESSAVPEIRIYFDSTAGTLYAQRSDDGSITDLLDQVSSLTFNYYKTIAGVTTEVASAPETATEVKITLTAWYGSFVGARATTTCTAYVALRNNIVNSW